MKKNKYLLAILATIIYSCTCKKEFIDHSISDNNRLKWNNNDKVVFKNNLQQKDTFNFYDKYDVLTYNSDKRNDCGRIDRFEVFNIYSKNTANNHKIFYGSSYSTQSNLGIYIDDIEIVSIKDTILTLDTINNNIYNNVHYLICDTINSSINKISKIYYNFPWGLLKYEFKNGDFWEIE